jgi:hypothetical protein
MIMTNIRGQDFDIGIPRAKYPNVEILKSRADKSTVAVKKTGSCVGASLNSINLKDGENDG